MIKSRICAALAIVFLLPGAAAARTQSDAEQLAAVVGTLLSQAPDNFAAMRLARKDSDTSFVSYKVKPFGTHCKACTLRDEYARGKYPENWYVSDTWTLPGKWAPPKAEAYAVQALRRTVSGFALHRTVGKYSKYPTLLWRGSGNRWVQIETYEGGYSIRVGHDLSKPVHVLRPLSPAQLANFSRAIGNIIRLGDPAGATNFQDLRMGTPHKNIVGEDQYDLNVTFGPLIRSCDATYVNDSLGFKDFQPKWVLSCETVGISGTAAQLRSTVHDAISSVLPAGYSAVTDPNEIILEDFAWESQDTQQSIDVRSDESDGVVHFTISIFHFLPKEPQN